MRYQFLFFQGMGWASDNCNLNLNFFFLVNTPPYHSTQLFDPRMT